MNKQEVKQWIDNYGNVVTTTKTKNGTQSVRHRKKIVNNYIISQQQLDLAQNTGFRNIVCSFAKSSELNRNLYKYGALMFYKDIDPVSGFSKIDYCHFAPQSYLPNGLPSVVTRVPLFQQSLDNNRTYVVGGDCVIWLDNVTFNNSGLKPISRAQTNKCFLDLSAQVITKLAKQLEISGSRLLGIATDTSQITEIQNTLQDTLDDEQLVQVLANNFKIDPQVLTIQPELTGYLQILQDINQVRQYHNGFGVGAFGTFKKERNLSGEIDQNDGNTNLVHMARVMQDKEFIQDMKIVFNEDVFIEWNGGNTGVMGGVVTV